MENILFLLGYTTKRKVDFYRTTKRGRLHVKLDCMTANSCKIMIHHDLEGPSHYTIPLDSVPYKAIKEIKYRLLSVYGKSFEL